MDFILKLFKNIVSVISWPESSGSRFYQRFLYFPELDFSSAAKTFLSVTIVLLGMADFYERQSGRYLLFCKILVYLL